MPSSERRTQATKHEEGLDDRKAAILEAVVSEYIGTAQPVGSQHVAAVPGVEVSSATVRAEMVALEREGYLAQPHTSAGRVPTDKGYRFFVDRLAAPGVLGPHQRQQVRRFFEQVHGEMEELLERASGLLSDLTSYAAVVVGPTHESAAIRSVQLVGLGPRVGLLVVVLADGAVEKTSLELPDDLSDEALALANQALQRHLQGKVLAALPPVPPLGDALADTAVGAACEALAFMAGRGEADQVFVGRPSRLAGAFDAVDTVRSVLSILEQQMVMVTLLHDVLDRGLSVAIGQEHGFEPLASCAVVVSPVFVDGHDAGAVGLLGPTRMNYPQAMAAAHVVGQRLGEHLERVRDGFPAPTGGEAVGSVVARAAPQPTSGAPGKRWRARGNN